MGFQPQMYIEMDADVGARPDQTYDGGNFNINTFIAADGRGFLGMIYGHDDGVKPELEGCYLYEIANFDMNDFKDVLYVGSKAQESILRDKYLNGFQDSHLQEGRLIRLGDDEPLEARIAHILENEPLAPADNAATYNASLKKMEFKI